MDSKKKIVWSVISLLIAVLSIWSVLAQSKTMSVTGLIESLGMADPVWIIPAFICMLGFIYFEGAALLCIVKATGYKRSQLQGAVYSAADIYFSAITPSASGGQPASAFFMMRDKIPAGVATASLIANLIMYTLSVLVAGVFGAVFCGGVYWDFDLFPSRVLIIIGFAAFGGLLAIFIILLKKGRSFFKIVSRIMAFLHRHHLLHKIEEKQKKLDKLTKDYESCVVMMAGKSKALVMAFLFNLAQRVSQVLVPVMIYNAYYGPGSDSLKVFGIQSLVTVGSGCIPIPGAMGVSDYLLLDGFGDLLGSEHAIHLEMMSRGISFYTCIIICGVFILVDYLVHRNYNRRK